MSQFVLPQRLGFNVPPSALNSLMSKMYQRRSGPYVYPSGRGGFSGLGDNQVGDVSGDYTWDGRQWVLSSTGLPEDVTSGNLQNAIAESSSVGLDVNVPASLGPSTPLMSYYDLLAQAKLATCDPRDSVCVSNNVAKQAAVEDYWVSHKETVPVGTVLNFTPQTPAQVNEFYNASNPTGGDVVDTSGIMTVNGQVTPSSTGQSAASFFGTAAPAKPNQSVPPTTPLTPMSTGIQKTGQVLQAQAQQVADSLSSGLQTVETSTGLSGTTLLIGAAVAVGLLMFMEGKR